MTTTTDLQGVRAIEQHFSAVAESLLTEAHEFAEAGEARFAAEALNDAAIYRECAEHVASQTQLVDIVFAPIEPQDEPFSPRFVEVDRADGTSFKLGEWVTRPDGYLALRFDMLAAPPSQKPSVDEVQLIFNEQRLQCEAIAQAYDDVQKARADDTPAEEAEDWPGLGESLAEEGEQVIVRLNLIDEVATIRTPWWRRNIKLTFAQLDVATQLVEEHA